ncbi:unnamed protein product [Lactuca saligna]|uniref:Uncharacterized protein n=1 Tax=Lactuca saligna TaxID=75948 RepID=A0AA35YN12_LACSI|nr:unnamed protein product [Lactuca saligna]
MFHHPSPFLPYLFRFPPYSLQSPVASVTTNLLMLSLPTFTGICRSLLPYIEMRNPNSISLPPSTPPSHTGNHIPKVAPLSPPDISQYKPDRYHLLPGLFNVCHGLQFQFSNLQEGH